VYDTVGDGICCDKGQGFLAIYFGTEIVRDKVLLWEPGDFGSGRSQPLTVSLKSTFVISPSPTVTPTLSPSPTKTVAPTFSLVDVIVQIQFDRYVTQLHQLSLWPMTKIYANQVPPRYRFYYCVNKRNSIRGRTNGILLLLYSYIFV
jgi:hypothetical protein